MSLLCSKKKADKRLPASSEDAVVHSVKPLLLTLWSQRENTQLPWSALQALGFFFIIFREMFNSIWYTYTNSRNYRCRSWQIFTKKSICVTITPIKKLAVTSKSETPRWPRPRRCSPSCGAGTLSRLHLVSLSLVFFKEMCPLSCIFKWLAWRS